MVVHGAPGLLPLLLVASWLAGVSAELWAVLVAGSSSYHNYRHQADICHAYHVLIARGVHEDRIITMMYDDVASDPKNPFPGKLYNRPSDSLDEAVDVYDGCRINYNGSEATPENFLAVLAGNDQKVSGKVLRSGMEDHVFVNFVGHGAVGLLAFPPGSGKGRPSGMGILHASEMVKTIEVMYQNSMYAQLVFYLEASEGGSMFEEVLSRDFPVCALTSANASEPAFGSFCGQEAEVGGTKLHACLGDEFSVGWMEDSDSNKDDLESLGVQFERVAAATTKSKVMQYGQCASFAGELVSDFQGATWFAEAAGSSAATVRRQAASKVSPRRLAAEADVAVDARDTRRSALYEEIRGRGDASLLASRLKSAMGGGEDRQGVEKVNDKVLWSSGVLPCHEEATQRFAELCGWTEERLGLSRTLHGLCARSGGDAVLVARAVRRACAGDELVV